MTPGRNLQAAAGEGVTVSSCLFGCLGVSISGLLRLLLGSQGVDLLAGLEQAAVVLLLDLGADIVERHESGSALEVVVNLHSILVLVLHFFVGMQEHVCVRAGAVVY